MYQQVSIIWLVLLLSVNRDIIACCNLHIVIEMQFYLSDPTTIFRGNTLVSKMMDEGMRLAGLHYLHSTLRPAMEQVFLEKKPCEIDPTRVKDGNTTDTNLTNLKVLNYNSNILFKTIAKGILIVLSFHRNMLKEYL